MTTMTEEGAAAGHFGLAEGTEVMTLRGPRAVEKLRAGDRIVTRAGALRLAGVERAAAGSARLMRISAAALAPDRPEADIVVAADQPILVRDWRAPALAGAERAMIPAARLADGEYIRTEPPRDLGLYVLRFETPAVIYAQGLELGCQGVMVTA
jgi:hypothetical protein